MIKSDISLNLARDHYLSGGIVCTFDVEGGIYERWLRELLSYRVAVRRRGKTFVYRTQR